MVVRFDEIWEVKNGVLTNLKDIRCGGVVAYKSALKDFSGNFGGVPWTYFIGHDLEIDVVDGIYTLRGIY